MRRPLRLLVSTSFVLLVAACSDTLPPLPDAGGNPDGATSDGQSPRPDATPPPDVMVACVDNDGCGAASYCRFPSGCQGSGICVVRPLSCPDVGAPTCGCDGVTYGSPCAAEIAGVNVSHAGQCVMTGCASPDDCDEQSFCNLDGHCGADGQLGSCEPVLSACPQIYEPVCGCDNRTYNNDCEAHVARTAVQHGGECSPVDPSACDELETKYAEILDLALTCVDSAGSQRECNRRAQSSLACPCDVYVTDLDAASLQALSDLVDRWSVAACDRLNWQCTTCPPTATDPFCDLNIGRCVNP